MKHANAKKRSHIDIWRPLLSGFIGAFIYEQFQTTSLLLKDSCFDDQELQRPISSPSPPKSKGRTHLFTFPDVPVNTSDYLYRDYIPMIERMAHPKLSTCIPTGQVRILQDISNSNNHNHQWMLQTVGEDGVDKQVGGDEFTVVYMANEEMTDKNQVPRLVSEQPTAVALIDDQEDGTYRLDFYRTPYGVENPGKLNFGDGRLFVD
ncbi:MAG: hypothetical protein SGARI_002375 [Bacillariaceae sp.]